MKKCISRQAVHDLVDELARALSDERCHISRGRSPATIMQNILELPSIQSEQRWIPVSERLPEEAYGCLVTIEIDNPLTCEYASVILHCLVGYDGETWNDSDGIPLSYEVIAWMPVPLPYKAESEEVCQN